MGDGPIAIVGVSCRFPGADGLESFWQLLLSGTDAVSEVDCERWATRLYYHPRRSEAAKSYTWAAGLIRDIDRFEPSFFGISPREAVQMDPQQRLLLELVWHAFEDAGIPPSRLAGTETGVYIGASATEYSDLQLGDPAGGDSYFMTGNALSILANRISYIFDLRGPSLTVDTACSSSLVALHHACAAIRSGQISSAIVGGVNLLLTPYPFLGFCRASMLSRRGRCFAFDERADGYVRGEGAAAIIVKPLADALAAGDSIRAVILATGSNSDGRTIGMSLPSETAQATLLRAVYRDAGIVADNLAFFEMHGTGTPAGDPVETAAVGRAIAVERRAPLPIGSVKTNIGHLEPASGMAGLLKAVLALEHGIVPASLHCDHPNPNIPFAELKLRLVHEAEPIVLERERRCAGVNSFGFGGTNAHVVLAGAPRLRETNRASGAVPPLLISAATETSLHELVGRWRPVLADVSTEHLLPLVRAAARGRDHHRHRLAVLASSGDDLAPALDGFLTGSAAPSVVAGTAISTGKLAFVFSGNGAQFPEMGRAALRFSAAFRAAVEEVDQILGSELGWSVLDLMERGVDAAAVARADIAQPLLFAVQVGIVGALREAGVTACGHVGHSVGEISAAWAAGALSLADAAHVVTARSSSQQLTQGMGRMAALALGHNAAREFLAEIDSPAEIAALNAAYSVTVSDAGNEIARVAAAAHARGLWCRQLDLDFAFHSRQMDSIRSDLLGRLTGLASQPPTARLMSTVTGAAIEEGGLDAEHWWRNIRHPVRFADAVSTMIGEDYRIFVEIGPNPILHSYLLDALRSADAEGRVLASLRRNDGEADPFPGIAAHCYAAGYDLAAATPFDGDAEPRDVPLYPWDRQRFWLEKTIEAVELQNPPFDHPLLGFRQSAPQPCWLNHLDEQLLPWIADHAVEGVPVLPAAAILEIALAAARWRWPDAPVLEASDVEIRRPLPFDKGRLRELRTMLVTDDGDWELASRIRLSDEPLATHAVGRVSAATSPAPRASWPDGAPARSVDARSVDARSVDAEALYGLARDLGLDYGTRFRTVDRVEVIGPGRAVVYFAPAVVDDAPGSYLLHPTVLDGALQGLLGLLAERESERSGASYLPWRFGRVTLMAPFGRICRSAQLRLTRLGVTSASADLALYDAAGEMVAEVTDCWFRRIALGRRASAGERMFHVDLIPAPLAAESAAVPTVLQDIRPVLSRLATALAASNRPDEASLFEAMIGAAALQALNGVIDNDQAFAPGDLVDRGRLAVGSEPLVTALLRLLESLGGASEADGEWRLQPIDDLPEPGEIWRLLLAEAPDLTAELALVAAALDRLPRTFAEGLARLPPGSAAMVEQMLQASPASAAGLDLLADALRAIAADWPAERPLRILEIGANSSATRRLLQCLAQSPATIAYQATSADPAQVERLSVMMQSFVGASACSWTPQQAAEDLSGRFDLVLAVNACARLQVDAASLAALRDRLVPGGLLIAVEPEQNACWDLVFGQAPNWWLPDRSGSGSSPLRAAEDWRAELAAAGFHSAHAHALGSRPWPSAVFWGTAPQSTEPAETTAPASRKILIIGEDTLLRGALADELTASGHDIVAALSASDFHTGPGGLAGAEHASDIVFLAPQQADGSGHPAQQIAQLAEIAHRAAEPRALLWLVTCDAQQPMSDAAAGVAGAALWGLARVLANELPRLPLRLLDLSSAVAGGVRARQIADELAAATEETEIVWTPRGRHVLRLRPGLPPLLGAPGQSLVLANGSASGFDSLGWDLRPERPLGAGEVEIDVGAAGLNFRDVMWAMGLLPEEALIDGFAGPSFGLECAGTVRAVGEGVAGVAVGDRVMAFAPAALGTRVVTVADAVAPIPPEIGDAAAVTLPVAFVTAIYALSNLAQLTSGEYVLIHAAAGGVGLAAIQYAKHCGAVVIATAGSETKRAFLRLAGADHVLDSRDLCFADAVREITKGEGVEVVLNSLGGEAMERSLEVLKPFGRFLELGKRDFYLNRRLHMRPLRQNISYFAIDVDQLPVRRPALARSLLSEVSRLLGAGAIRPLAYRLFRFSEIEDAFRLMQSSGHIGKIVLVPGSRADLALREAPGFTARRDGTYLVTGGINGFGFAAARWLATHGAGTIAVLGRRGTDTPGCAERIAELEAAGARVCVYRGDVADRASLAAVLDQIRAAQPPLRGVVHAASAIDDRLTADLDQAGIEAVLRPKLDGALALDALTQADPLELFVLFSSATTLLGAPGQGAYVAANLALEALARQRRAAGRPALAIAWGPIEDAGYLADRPETREALARRLGAKPVTAAQALSGLPAMLATGLPVVVCAEASWGEARRYLPLLATPLFSEIRWRGGSPAVDEALPERLRSLEPEAALTLLKTVVAEEAARILRLPAGSFDPARPLSQFGMDSLMAVELRLALESRLRIDLPLVSLVEGTSVASIAARLAAALAVGAAEPEVAVLAARYEAIEQRPGELPLGEQRRAAETSGALPEPLTAAEPGSAAAE